VWGRENEKRQKLDRAFVIGKADRQRKQKFANRVAVTTPKKLFAELIIDYTSPFIFANATIESSR